MNFITSGIKIVNFQKAPQPEDGSSQSHFLCPWLLAISRNGNFSISFNYITQDLIPDFHSICSAELNLIP